MASNQWIEQLPGAGGPSMRPVYLREAEPGVLVDTLDPTEATHMETLLPDGTTVWVTAYVPGYSLAVAVGKRAVDVRLGAASALLLSEADVLFSTKDNVQPAPVVLHVTAVGALSTALSADIEYLTGAAGWLTAGLGASDVPTTLTLTATASVSLIGTHDARVTVSGGGLAAPASVYVSLIVHTSLVTLGAPAHSRASTAAFVGYVPPLGAVTATRASTATYKGEG
jgi:hypothetical protein